MLIVSLDLFSVLIFFIFIARLKYLEKLTISDEQKKFIQIKDFTVYIPNLPIPAEMYRNNPDTLKAMLIDYFENQVSQMFQQVDKMDLQKSQKMS